MIFRLLFNNTFTHEASRCLEQPGDFQLLDEGKSQLNRQTEMNTLVSMLCVLTISNVPAASKCTCLQFSMLHIFFHCTSEVHSQSELLQSLFALVDEWQPSK